MGCLLDRALKVAEEIKYDGNMTQARCDSLSDVMTATCDAAVKEIINIGKWTETDVTRKLERDIVKVQKEVMSGRGKLIDFRQACQRWKAAGIK